MPAWQLAYALVPVGAALAVFAGAARHGFIWDDPLVLEQLRHIHGALDLLVPPDAVPKFYYRPLIFLTFLIDRALGGEAPFWFHITVIAWHALVTGLVYLLARQALGAARSFEASLAALLFAAHPIHVESVAWIAGRSDVIATAFVVAAVLAAAKTGRAWTAWAAGGLVLIGLLAKEVAVAAVVLVPARDLCVDRRLPWRRYLPLLIAVVAYILLRRAGLGAVATGEPTGAGPLDTAASLAAAVSWYASKLVLPINVSAYVPSVPAAPPYTLAGLGVLAATLGGAGWAWRRRRGMVAFLLIWFPVTLAPSLVVIARRSASAVLAERYLYLPSIAPVLLAGWALVQVQSPRVRRGLVAFVLLGSVVGAWQSAVRSRVWADDLVFWGDVVAKAPREAMPRRELANAFMRRGRLDEAEREFTTALALPASVQDQVMAYNNLGNLYLRRDDLDAAARAFTSGLKRYRHPYLLNGMGRLAMKRAERAQARGDQAEVIRQVRAARESLQEAIAIDPRDFRSRVLLGQVLLSLGERAAARSQLEAALRIEPRGPIAETARHYLQQSASP